MPKKLRLHEQKKQEICSAVVVAAGNAARMEGVDKVFVPLAGVPVLVHALRAFQICSGIAEIIVVTREDRLKKVSDLCQEYELHKVTKVILGGKERIQSVQKGCLEVRPDATLIAIHDAARPLLSQEILHVTLSQASAFGAAVPAIPITDTVKRVQDGLIVETLDRRRLFCVQTPQIFDADLIRSAVQNAIDHGEILTDECSAIERMGMKAVLTAGSRENLKLTTPLDLVLARAILDERGEP